MDFRENPVVVGLAGSSCTGKTSTADALSPMAKTKHVSPDNVIWTHLFFALPLYELASVRRNVEGDMRRDRMRYQIHSILNEVFGNNPLFGAPPYHKLVEMVEEIVTYPFPKAGKPREFLQYIGTDLCRAYDEDCWVKWMRRKITHELIRLEKELTVEGEDDDSLFDELLYDPPLNVVLLSDVRFPNEGEFVKSYPNSLLFRFTARPEVIEMRQQSRDGYTMAEQYSKHSSETSIDLIDESLYDVVLDTSDLTLDEQVKRVKETILEYANRKDLIQYA